MLLKHCTGMSVNRKSQKDQRQPSNSPPIRTRNSFSHTLDLLTAIPLGGREWVTPFEEKRKKTLAVIHAP